MSTRSLIAIRAGNKIVGNYCHYDGYPEHVGKILVQHHNSLAAAQELFKGAQIRCFETTGEAERFTDGRGRQMVYPSTQNAVGDFDYVYVYGRAGWKCYRNDYKSGKVKVCKIPA